METSTATDTQCTHLEAHTKKECGCIACAGPEFGNRQEHMLVIEVEGNGDTNCSFDTGSKETMPLLLVLLPFGGAERLMVDIFCPHLLVPASKQQIVEQVDFCVSISSSSTRWRLPDGAVVTRRIFPFDLGSSGFSIEIMSTPRTKKPV